MTEGAIAILAYAKVRSRNLALMLDGSQYCSVKKRVALKSRGAEEAGEAGGEELGLIRAVLGRE
ncbi:MULTISPECIES: hypothetical protein [unclassified Coleofasciculus]|uniref:hypothetical protein n=1 Tax=unclassified Coleofasciculus TaxID=2692782 RepID=UPI00187E1BEC|nr:MULTISPECIES: hypothetical protein [unclassified Coleofasciculus]MBE9127698.1 hypothetical protein [Coleofasciculus sp. LEGE 07081]MBE9151036.1 hypothetical protein [Coleofasciculus sp. LEGE 07092]